MADESHETCDMRAANFTAEYKILTNTHMRLAEFILSNVEPILIEWDAFARGLSPGKGMTKLALRNDSESILRTTVKDMQAMQSAAQQSSKSQGHGGAGGKESDALDHASAMHGVGRVGSGFDIVEVISEYRALRASVLRLWRESLPQADVEDIADVTRFNEAMDQSLAKAVASYTKRVDQSRRMFLAILGHDLRNPLNCIRMATQLVSATHADPDSAEAFTMIETNTEAIARLVSDLIDFSSTGLGSEMPLTRGMVDLVALCEEVTRSFRSTHRDRTVHLHAEGSITGMWDAARFRQVISNLLGNALQHGAADSPIELSVKADDGSVVLSVHNDGSPIPKEMLATIFDPLVRSSAPELSKRRAPGSIGLGLYIVREIVLAHGGNVAVTSTATDGTTFTVRVPQQMAVAGAN